MTITLYINYMFIFMLFLYTVRFHPISVFWSEVSSSSEGHTQILNGVCMCVFVSMCSICSSPDLCTYIISSKPSTSSLYICAKQGFSGGHGLLALPSLPAGINCGRKKLLGLEVMLKWRSIDVWSCQLLLEVGGKGTPDSLIYQLF